MQAYKLKGTIDASGHLIITEPIHLMPGEVEIILLQPTPPADAAPPKRQKSKVKALQEWFERTQPVPPDFAPDQAKWEALKEKYGLEDPA
jgi:hypothetical protein